MPILLNEMSFYLSFTTCDHKPCIKQPAGNWLVDGEYVAESVSLEENRCGGESILRNSPYAVSVG